MPVATFASGEGQGRLLGLRLGRGRGPAGNLRCVGAFDNMFCQPARTAFLARVLTHMLRFECAAIFCVCCGYFS